LRTGSRDFGNLVIVPPSSGYTKPGTIDLDGSRASGNHKDPANEFQNGVGQTSFSAASKPARSVSVRQEIDAGQKNRVHNRFHLSIAPLSSQLIELSVDAALGFLGRRGRRAGLRQRINNLKLHLRGPLIDNSDSERRCGLVHVVFDSFDQHVGLPPLSADCSGFAGRCSLRARRFD
jgi:hypothetical protein